MNVDQLAYDYETARESLAAAQQRVAMAEAALLAAVPAKLEGSLTTALEFYKVTTTGKLNRALDAAKLEALRAAIPATIFDRVIRYKPDLSLRDLRYMEDNEPEYYRAFAGAITTKPAKTSLKVERLKP